MLKKLVITGFALVMVLGLAGCDMLEGLFGGTTGVEGKLELAAGVDGDLDDTRVYLFDNSDFDGSAEESEDAVEDKDDETEATFKFEDIDADDYYLLAWKDIDDDDAISYGDLVGVYDGKYGEDEPEEIDVDEGEMTDIGTIKMYEYEGGGGTITSISVSGSFTDTIFGLSYNYVNVTYTHDTEWNNEDDYVYYIEVNSGSSFSETFDVPAGYQDGCYVIFWGDNCAELGVGSEYYQEWLLGFHGDQYGSSPTYEYYQLQENYTNIDVNMWWYAEDACPYSASMSTSSPNWLHPSAPVDLK